MLKPTQFQKKVLDWFEKHGRKNLPWQQPRDSYRVWLSEIMLQQTQVSTVIPYFEKFIKKFPTIKQLAETHIDNVLELWSGLGYYARARNLHRTAKIIQQEYQGKFPNNLSALENLPGIGKSTAGAILALGMEQRAAILDGNVKRVLTRYHAISGWPGENKIQQQLWKLAEEYTPEKQVAAYTQAMMDLGATLCTRSKPKCLICPLQKSCQGLAEGEPSIYPTPKKVKQLPVKQTQMLILVNHKGEILLEKRPPVGIWGGLWSLPEFCIDTEVQTGCQQKYGYHLESVSFLNSFRHTFSHFHLEITPVIAYLKKQNMKIMEAEFNWLDQNKLQSKGLPAPVKKLLMSLSVKI